MRVWRLTRQRHASTAFEGIGSERVGGRWSPRGLRVVYTSESIALCVLELLVHMEARQMHSSHVVIGVDTPDDVPYEEIAVRTLPENWQSYSAPLVLQNSGREWGERRQTAILKVPSAIVPYEYNYILNPAHPDFRRLQISPPQSFRFDTRLWKTS